MVKTFNIAAKSHTKRRIIFFSLVMITTLCCVGLLTSVFQKDGLNFLELILLVFYAILLTWVCFSFWAAVIGFFICLIQRDSYAISASLKKTDAPLAQRTALIMPVYNEDPHRVFAGLQAICESVVATGEQAQFDVFILSDTRNPNIWIEEEVRWHELSRAFAGKMRIYYRNRDINSERKVGNIKDFCTRWGGNYAYMIGLDADSLMSGETLVNMVRLMEQNPQVALIQVSPQIVNHTSLFARIQQFASSVYGKIFTTGLNFWQLSEGNYWGHNAIIRMQPFVEHCTLPHLAGREPFGGEILSHDFIEAAMLRRAGWEVWLAYDLGGSYEEIPPTLIDYVKRDRRWCEGNLQHTTLLFAKGWHPINRLHLLMGIMSYLASPLWLGFLIITGIDAYFRTQETHNYFLGHTLFPIWPPSYSVEMTTVLVITLTLLFFPKILGLFLIFTKPKQVKLYGGYFALTFSVLLETIASALLAPILMMFQTKSVIFILLRQHITWSAQNRDDHETSLTQAISAHGGQTLVAIIVGVVSYRMIPDYFWWLTPVLAGLFFSIPLSIFLSKNSLGLWTQRKGLFLIPEESLPPLLLQNFRRHLNQPQLAILDDENRFIQALINPHINALHAALLPSQTQLSKRHQHYLQGLVYKLLEEGDSKLTIPERRALLMNKKMVLDLHTLLWSLPEAEKSLGKVHC